MNNVGSQDFSYQADSLQEDEAESSHSPVDQDEDRQHDPLQCQEAPLEEDKAKAVNVQHELCGARALLPLLYFITHLVWNIIGDDSKKNFLRYSCTNSIPVRVVPDGSKL